jgi:hypothetical protein
MVAPQFNDPWLYLHDRASPNSGARMYHMLSDFRAHTNMSVHENKTYNWQQAWLTRDCWPVLFQGGQS